MESIQRFVNVVIHGLDLRARQTTDIVMAYYCCSPATHVGAFAQFECIIVVLRVVGAVAKPRVQKQRSQSINEKGAQL